MLKIVLFFIFINLIQIEYEMHVPVTVRFLDYVFNEIHTYVLFSRMGCFPDTPFLWQTLKLMNMSHLSFEKKNFLLAQFSVKFV